MTHVLKTLPRPRDVTRTFGLYMHIPFCVHRCWYCDFNAYAGLDHLAERYMDALATDIRSGLSAPEDADLGPRPTVTSVFIGGGTPTLVDAAGIADVLDAVRSTWQLDPGAEITIEANPESVSPGKLEAYLAAGVNRISIGVQSLDDALLATLGRTHDSRRALEALSLARRTGFERISADLIFGVPGESDETWERSLEGVLAAEPDHVSCYALTYEEGTPLHAWRRLGKVVPVDEDLVAARWETADRMLSAAGLERYEVSNWARPGQASDHNGLYWECGEYLGVGAGAHSHLACGDLARRSWTVRAPERYIERVCREASTVAGSEELTATDRAAEVMFCGLRRSQGVGADRFEALVGRGLEATYGARLRLAAAEGLLAWDGRRARLTDRGTLLGDAVVMRFLGA